MHVLSKSVHSRSSSTEDSVMPVRAKVKVKDHDHKQSLNISVHDLKRLNMKYEHCSSYGLPAIFTLPVQALR